MTFKEVSVSVSRMIEKTAKTVQEAINLALEELKLTINNVEVEVLEEGKTAIFGLLGGKQAKVRVTEIDRGTVPNGNTETDAKFDVEEDNEEEYVDDIDETDDEYTYDDDEDDDEDLVDDADRAVEFLKTLFEGIHVEVEMDVEIKEENIYISVSSDDSGVLIGHRGETLDAIQYLVNLTINRKRDYFVRVTLDIEGYRKKREETLVKVAERIAEKVIRLRKSMTMEAMNSYERRIVHAALQNNPKIETYSIGEDPNRKVVITLKNRGNYSSNQRRY